MQAPFSYTHGMLLPHWSPSSNYTRGVPVLRWADDAICHDKDMVQFLVWINPANLGSASFALQADPEIVSTALKSPFYKEKEPVAPSHCVLRYADEQIRNDRSFILDHLSSSAYEMEFIGPDLRADKTLFAWAGAPHGAISTMVCDQEYVQFLKSIPATGLSAAYVDEHQNEVFDIHAKYLFSNAIDNGRKICMQARWNAMKETDRQEWCTQMWRSLQHKLPLFFRVAPAMREVLWPTKDQLPWKVQRYEDATEALLPEGVPQSPCSIFAAAVEERRRQRTQA
jgi:hypothetical protein